MTRITFSDRSEIPAIFVRNEDGSESLLNFSMDGGDVVIHRLAPKFILRRGRLTGCIVNEGFCGRGRAPGHGTVSPRVEREREGAATMSLVRSLAATAGRRSGGAAA